MGGRARRLGLTFVFATALLWSPVLKGVNSITTATDRTSAPPAQSTIVPTPTPYVWPFTYTVSGPATAYAGDQVTYRVQYRRNSSTAPDSAGFVFNWEPAAALFVAATTVSGTQASLAEVEASDAFVEVPTTEGQGEVDITLEIKPNFAGTLTVGIDVRGTGITMPADSVDVARTAVSAPSPRTSPPNTGTDQASGWASAWIVRALAAGGLALLAAGSIGVRKILKGRR